MGLGELQSWGAHGEAGRLPLSQSGSLPLGGEMAVMRRVGGGERG